MINTGSGSYFLNNGVTAPQGLQMYAEDMISAAAAAATATAAVSSGSHTGDFLYNISLLKDKINQVQSLASFFISPHDQNLQQQPSYNYGSTAIAIASIGTLIQEIIVTATSVMYTCQQMTSVHNNNLSDGRLNTSSSGLWVNKDLINPDGVIERDPSGFYMSESLDWCGTTDVNKTTTCNTTTDVASRSNDISPRVCSRSSNNIVTNVIRDLPLKVEKNPEESVQEKMSSLVKNYDIVELKAADILAKYTHYCQVCGKGFKRDANLRMHMRAHGDEYKSSAALSNPLKNNNNNNNNGGEGQQGKAHDHGVVPAEVPRKYSCPHEGCRWNKKHAKFQPLKSMICVKNHYKRSHCPKMYVCKRCNKKQFSVLSDLRTHEKHCGDLKWQCSCGTTFSRKDKLMGHVALFVGHTPAISSLAKMGNIVD